MLIKHIDWAVAYSIPVSSRPISDNYRHDCIIIFYMHTYITHTSYMCIMDHI